MLFKFKKINYKTLILIFFSFLNLNNIAKGDTIIHNHNNNTQHQVQITEVTALAGAIVDTLRDRIQENLNQVTQNSLNFIKTHKYKACTIGLTSCYLLSLYKLSKLSNFCNQPNNWSNWQNYLNLNNLVSTHQESLYQDLDKQIKAKYELYFLQDIDNEINKINSYLKFIKVISFFRVNKLYLVSSSDIKLYEDKIVKLNYLKNLFLSWQNKDLNNKNLNNIS